MADFSVTYNGLTIDITNYHSVNGIGIDTLDGIDGLGIRVSEDLLTGDDGGNIWNRLYDMRTISFNGWLKSPDSTIDSYWEAKKNLVTAFSITSNTTLSITRWGETTSTRILDAKVITAPMIVENQGEVNFCRWRVELKCDSPFFKDETSTDYTITLPTGGGSPVAFPVPTPVGALSGGTQTINNEGDVSAYPELVRFNGPSTNPSLTNSTTGESFSINETIASGDYVDVFENQQGFFVLLNGTTNYYDKFSGEFFKLTTGNNILRFNASGGTGNCVVTWRNNYLTLG